jgi:hypothetical protein
MCSTRCILRNAYTTLFGNVNSVANLDCLRVDENKVFKFIVDWVEVLQGWDVVNRVMNVWDV